MKSLQKSGQPSMRCDIYELRFLGIFKRKTKQNTKKKFKKNYKKSEWKRKKKSED